MPKSTPLKVTLYDPETNEVIHEFTQMFIPWRMFKAAIRISKQLGNVDLNDLANLPEELYDELTALICEIFGHRFTPEELGNGAEFGDMIPVINQILAKAGALGNPTKPGN